MTQRTPKSELESRIHKLQVHLAANDLDGALILQNADLFYFSGTIQQSHLYVPVEGQPLLMTRKSLARARQESALDNVVPLSVRGSCLLCGRSTVTPGPGDWGWNWMSCRPASFSPIKTY